MNCENDDETESKMSIEDDNSKKKFIKIKELKNLQDMEKEDIRISNMIGINVKFEGMRIKIEYIITYIIRQLIMFSRSNSMVSESRYTCI